MIVLNITYHCKPGKRDAFLEALSKEGIGHASRMDEGNLKYDYYLSADDENELMLVEKWEDAETLSAHGKKPHLQRLGELKKEFVEETTADRFII